MSQIPRDNDDNRSVAGSDFVQFEQPEEVVDQEEQQQQHRFGLHQNPLNWTMNTGSTHNYDNGLKEMKWMMANLQANIQTLQANVKNLELEAKIRAMEEKAERKTNYQALEAKMNDIAQMLSTHNEQRQMESEELEAKNRMLEKKLTSRVEVQTTKNEAPNGQQAIGSNLNKLDYMWEQLVVKSKILANPKGIIWDRSKTEASTSISECGLKATVTDSEWGLATEGYAISGEQCRKENFPFAGTIVFYCEVKITSDYWYSVGFSDGSKPAAGCVTVGGSTNCYGIAGCGANAVSLWLSGKQHILECRHGAIAEPDVSGCGLLLNSKNELAVFFTRNGILLGKQIRINPTVDRLYPTVSIYRASIEANFGDNLVAKPFMFDTDKCPGLIFE